MKPKRASARQKFGATSSIVMRSPDAIHGTEQDLDAQHEQMLVQGAVMLDVPDHHRRRIALGPGQEHRRAGHARHVLRP